MWSTNSIYLVFLGTGVTVGFGHCIGMCGPIVISLSLNIKDRPSVMPHLLYNVGRTLTYGIMGAAVGATASFTRFAGGIAGLQETVMVVAGVAIVAMGMAMTGWLPSTGLFSGVGSVGRRFGPLLRRLFQQRNQMVYLPVGMLLGLLPCGPVYTALLAATRTGMTADSTAAGAVYGSAVMLCFGLGTIPALFILSRISNVKWLKHRDLVYRLGGMMMIGMGLYFIWKAVNF